MTLDEIEKQTILQALERYKGNLSQVATALGTVVQHCIAVWRNMISVISNPLLIMVR